MKIGNWKLRIHRNKRLRLVPVAAILLFAGFFSAQEASALTCNDQADGNWGSAGTWSCGAIPGSGDTVTIDSHTVTLTQAQSAASVTMQGGTFNMASYTLSIGDWTYTSGTLNAGTSTLKFASNTASFTSGSVEYYNLEFDAINGGSVYTISGNPTVKNNLLLTTGGGSSFTINGGTLNVYGNISNTHTAPIYGTYAINIVGSNNQTISQSSGSTYFTSVTVNKSAGVLTVSGTVIISDSWTYTAGKVDFGTSTLQFSTYGGNIAFVPGSVTYYDIAFVTYPGGVILNVNGNLKLSNLFSLTGTNSGTVNTNGYAITAKDFTFNASSTTFNAGSSVIKLSGNFTRTAGTFSASTSTVILTGTNQSITGATTFYNLYKMLPAGTAGTLTFGASTTYTIAAGGTARFIGSRDGLLSLRSSSPGTAYTFVVFGFMVTEYVDLQDCTVSTSATARASINTSGNTNWTFTREFVSKIRSTGGDYTTLSGWESAVQNNLTTSKVFSHGGITGTMPDNTAVTGATSGATGTAVHTTSTQILIKTITGTFQSGEQIRVDASNYVTSSDAGFTPIAVAEVYNDWSASGLNDSVTLSGWTPNVNNYVLIVAPQGQRHQGLLKNPATGWYRGFTLKPTGAGVTGIDNQLDYTRIEGIAVDLASASGTTTSYKSSYTSARFDKDIAANGTTGFNLSGGAFVANSLAYDATGNCFQDVDATTTHYTVYNSTARGCAYGFYGDNTTTAITLKNVLASGNTTADFSLTNTGAKSVTYSASSDATSDDYGTPTGDRVSQTFLFQDATGKDFRLGPKDSGARDFGTDLLSDATYPIIDDIEYESRPAIDPYDMNSAVWDIGGDEMDPDTPRIKDGVRLKGGTRLK